MIIIINNNEMYYAVKAVMFFSLVGLRNLSVVFV